MAAHTPGEVRLHKAGSDVVTPGPLLAVDVLTQVGCVPGQSASVVQAVQGIKSTTFAQVVPPSLRFAQRAHAGGQTPKHGPQTPASRQLGVSPRPQVPQVSVRPQPSTSGPQVLPWAAQVVGVHAGQAPGIAPRWRNDGFFFFLTLTVCPFRQSVIFFPGFRHLRKQRRTQAPGSQGAEATAASEAPAQARSHGIEMQSVHGSLLDDHQMV